MRLDLERDRIAIADLDDAGVLTWTLQHPWRLCRQLLEQRARVLVAAVLGPECAEQSQLGVCRLAADRIDNAIVFLFTEAVIGDELRCDRRITRARCRSGERVHRNSAPDRCAASD